MISLQPSIGHGSLPLIQRGVS